MKELWNSSILASTAFIIGIVLIGGADLCLAQTGKGQRVQSVEVQLQNIVRSVEMPGTVEGFKTAELYSKIGGFLKDISVDIGDEVKKDQVLAHLSVPEMEKEILQKQALLVQARAETEQTQAAVTQAEAKVTSAIAALSEAQTQREESESQLRFRQVEVRRYQDLVNSNSARRELLDQANFQLESATAGIKSVLARIQTAEAHVNAEKANLARAKADVKSALAHVNVAQANLEYSQIMKGYATIKAPFNGTVVMRNVDPGAFIQSADGNSAAKPLLTITHTDVVRVLVDIPMKDVRLLDRGDKAVLNRLTVMPGEEFVGTVTRFSPALGKRSRLMRAEVDFGNADHKLWPGYFGYMTIHLEELKETPVIPSSALLVEKGVSFVYICENGKARRQPVDVSYHDGSTVGISSGLKGGEKIIKTGGGQIADGERIDAVPVN